MSKKRGRKIFGPGGVKLNVAWGASKPPVYTVQTRVAALRTQHNREPKNRVE